MIHKRSQTQLVMYVGLVLGLALLFPSVVFGQSSQSLSVTPPLFQLSVDPGDVWQSSVKVVNPNDFPLSVYTEVVNFAPMGEGGVGRFMPIFDEERDGLTLAEWIVMQPGPYTIPPQQTKEVPFIIEIPEEASPGGHFAAILVSTEPPASSGEAVALVTSQAVSSLFFLRIEGDVIEDGAIREFSVKDTFVSQPSTHLLLRFENRGNVHLQPQGYITIKNMWGTERGKIPINQGSRFGNVLPESIRAYEFSWRGELSFSDIGRYTAELTLSYGDTSRQNVSSQVSFWVVPVKATLITIGSIIAFIIFVVWVVRLYVRRMLMMAGVDIKTMKQVGRERATHYEDDIQIASYKNVTAPIKAGAKDLQSRLQGVHAFIDVVKTLISFVIQYKLFFISVLIVIIGFVVGVMYIVGATTETNSYEVRIGSGETQEVIDSEAVLKEEIASPDAPINIDQSFKLKIVNASGRAGAAAEVAVILEELGYRVDDIATDFESERSSTVIIFKPDYQTEAEAISSTLGGALLSAAPPESTIEYDIVIYVGRK